MKIRKQNWLTLLFLAIITAVSLYVWISMATFKPVKVTRENNHTVSDSTGIPSLYLTANDNQESTNWIPLSRNDGNLTPTPLSSYALLSPQVQDEVYKHFSLFDRPNLLGSHLVLENDELQLWQADSPYGDKKAQLNLTLIHKNKDGNWTYTIPNHQLDQGDRTGNQLISLAEDDESIYLVYAFLQGDNQANYLKTFELTKENGEIRPGNTKENPGYDLFSFNAENVNRHPKLQLMSLVDTEYDDNANESSRNIYEIIDPKTGESQQMDTSSLESQSNDQTIHTDILPVVIGEKTFVVTYDYTDYPEGGRPKQLKTYLYNSDNQDFKEIWQLDIEDNPDYYIENGFLYHTVTNGKNGYLECIDIATGQTTTIEKYTIEENSPYTFAKMSNAMQ